MVHLFLGELLFLFFSHRVCIGNRILLVKVKVVMIRLEDTLPFRVVTHPTKLLHKKNTAPCLSTNSTLQKYLSTSMFDTKQSGPVCKAGGGKRC